MKGLLMRSYNPAELVNVKKITPADVEDAKKRDVSLSQTITDEYDIKQTLIYENGLKLKEVARQKNDKFESEQTITINLKEGDVLLHTDLGYKVNLLPIKIVTDKEERLIEKYNQLGK